MIRTAFATTILLPFLFLLNCGPRQEVVEPEILLPRFDSAIRDHYYFYPDSDYSYNLHEIYAESLKPITGYPDRAAEIQQVIQNLQASSGDAGERSENAFRFVDQVLLRLPDQSSYYIDNVSLKLLEDPDRKAGTGIVIRRTEDQRFKIVDVLDGSPARRSEVPIGSYIESVDDRSVEGLSVEGLAARIRGPVDSEVQLTLDGKSYSLIRSQFPGPAPARNTWEMNGKKVLIIQIRSGLEGAADDLRNLLKGSQDRSALVLDLRKLNYGDFNEIFRMADLLVSEGTLGSTKARPDKEKVYQATEEILFKGPIYVLVSTSASPFSEVLAAALKASPRVTLIGPRLRGNAFTADSVDLGEGRLRLTSGIILGPSGEPLHLKGIPTDISTPDHIPDGAPLSSPTEDDPAHQAVLNAMQ